MSKKLAALCERKMDRKDYSKSSSSSFCGFSSSGATTHPGGVKIGYIHVEHIVILCLQTSFARMVNIGSFPRPTS